MSGSPPSPFDTLAPDYDDAFSRSAIGRLMRRAANNRLDRLFAAGQSVLDLGCGTGEDALHLGRRGVKVKAIDSSAGMVQVARDKIERAGLQHLVQISVLPIEQLAGPPEAGEASLPVLGPAPFDGVLANFGALNCVADLPGLARGLARCTRPGAHLALCIMGPVVPWEWGWYLARGQPRQAFRRLRRGGVAWREVTVHYHSISATDRAFSPHFERRDVAAVGALLPPTYAEAWATRHPALLRLLDRAERRLETRWPLYALADHYLLEMVRR